MHLTQFIFPFQFILSRKNDKLIMEAYSWLAISGILGLLLGMSPRLRNSFCRILYSQSQFNPNYPSTTAKKRYIPSIEFAKCNFDEKELQFINQLINLKKDGNGVSIDFLNAIIDPEKINLMNNRLTRHGFLNDLNLKLFLIYGIKEAIIRKGTIEDRRKKSYFLDQSISIHRLEQDFQVKFKQLVGKKRLSN
jgi:hypothetical protein